MLTEPYIDDLQRQSGVFDELPPHDQQDEEDEDDDPIAA